MIKFIPLHNLLAHGRPCNHPVCHNGERFITWLEFSSQVLSLTESLKTRLETRWLITSNDPQDFVIQLLALLYAGKHVVIPPNIQSGTLVQLASKFDAISSNEITQSQAISTTLPILNANTAIIDLYTSGSTGEPKQVRKTLAQFEAEIVVLEKLWGKTLGLSTLVATVPHNHIYGLIFRLLWPLTSGRPFDTVTCAHPETLSSRLAKFQQSTLISSPAQLSRLPDLVTLTSLSPVPKLIFSSGGPLPKKTSNEFHLQLDLTPIEIFGSTETGGIAWRQQNIDDSWTPFPKVMVTCGIDGAISINSPFLAENKTWRMEDAIELLPNGKFLLLGRLDRIVKVEEKKLSLHEMETRLRTHSWVDEATVILVSGRRQYIGAAVVLSAIGRKELELHGRRTITQQLRLHLSENFEAVVLPKRWRFLEQMPINPHGKLTYANLSALFTIGGNSYAPS